MWVIMVGWHVERKSLGVLWNSGWYESLEEWCGILLWYGSLAGVAWKSHQWNHSVDHHLTQPSRPQPRPPPLSLPRPWIGYILIAVDDAKGLMDGPCDKDASSSCAAM